GYAVLTFFIQDRMNLILPAVNPALTLLLGGIGCLSYEFVLEQREKRRVRGMFSTMVSPEVLAYMQADPDRFRLTGEKKMATMFFSDLAGFTTISESVTAEDLAKILNRYLTPMSNLVMPLWPTSVSPCGPTRIPTPTPGKPAGRPWSSRNGCRPSSRSSRPSTAATSTPAWASTPGRWRPATWGPNRNSSTR
ncbi:MAG: hypothetical protein EBZ05_03120, partial [Verrucomicrobia bacterium]|nr:hypothetical protein [Verrucomicrobiota bacterium]